MRAFSVFPGLAPVVYGGGQRRSSYRGYGAAFCTSMCLPLLTEGLGPTSQSTLRCACDQILLVSVLTGEQHGGDVPGTSTLGMRFSTTEYKALGFKSQLIRFPTEGLGIAVLSNDEMYGSYIQEVIKGRLADEALKLVPMDWNVRSLLALSYDTGHLAYPKPYLQSQNHGH